MVSSIVDFRTTLITMGFAVTNGRNELTYKTRNGAIIVTITGAGKDLRILITAKHNTDGDLMSKEFEFTTTWGTAMGGIGEASNMLDR